MFEQLVRTCRLCRDNGVILNMQSIIQFFTLFVINKFVFRESKVRIVQGAFRTDVYVLHLNFCETLHKNTVVMLSSSTDLKCLRQQQQHKF